MWPFGLRPGRNQAAQAIMLVQLPGVPAVPVPATRQARFLSGAHAVMHQE
jgi:hypothetical protein